MRERILAVVGAIGLVVGALILRGALAGSSDSSDEGPTGGTGSTATPVIACSPDLQSVCDALVEDGYATAAPSLDLVGAAEPEVDVDGWITWDPAPRVADIDRPDTWARSEVLASAPLGVLVAGGTDACPAPSAWLDCVVAAADQGLPVGVGEGTSAQSLARLHPVAAALVPPDGDFTAISATSLRRVTDSTQLPQADYSRQLNTFLTQRGALRLVVGPVPALQAAASRQPEARVVPPTPAADITVVLAVRHRASGVADIDAARLLEPRSVQAALDALGLEPGTGDLAPDSRAGEAYSIRSKVR